MGASPPPASGDWFVVDDTTVSAVPIHLSGNLTVSAGATLTLSGSILYMEAADAWISLEMGARLVLTAGGAIKDSPSDTDDGSAADWAYSIAGAASSSIELAGASIEGSSGIGVTDGSILLRDSVVKMNRGPIALLGVTVLAAHNTSFVQNTAPLFDVQGTSSAVVEGKGVPTFAAGPMASFSYSSFLAVRVNDTSGKPLGGADWAFETGLGVLGGSMALGGMLPTTRLDHEGFATPMWVLAPYVQQTAGVRTYLGVVARVSFAEWSDARSVNASADGLIMFTSMNRGVVLQDHSMEAMLDVYHGMMEGMNGMGGMDPMGGMGGMPGMEGMMGPMMTQGPGSAWGDFNGDGFVDAVVTAAPETDEMFLMEMMMNVTDYPAPQLFLGSGDGMFHHEMMSGLEGAPGASGVSAGDFDGDGDLDLFVARYGNGGMAMEDSLMRVTFMDGHPLTSFIFENDGGGMFTDVSSQAGFDMPSRYTTGGVWNDYNRDGCLDLYVVNMGQMVMAMMEGMPMDEMMHMGMEMNFIKPQANYLYKNDCDGTFTDVTAAAGAPTGGGPPGSESAWQGLLMDPVQMYWYGNLTGKNLGGSGLSYTAAFFDYNEDGWQDLLVANDFGYSPLYRNNGDGTFTLQTAEAGLDKIGSAMGFAIADYDRDDHLDVFQSNFNEDYLWMSNGDGTFTDRADEFGVADMAVGWGVAAPDLNNDAFPDLAISTGYMSMMMKASERSSVYINDEGVRFWDGSAGSGIDRDPALGISIATADVDADGRLDLFLGKTTGMNRVYLNREGGGHQIRLDLHGRVSNSYGVGAEVTAVIGGKPFRTAVQPGGEYASSNEPGVFIGLGTVAEAKRVTVTWPSGIVQALGDVMAGARLTVRESVGAVVDAGPDGFADTSVPVLLTGSAGAEVRGSSYTWIFHGPTGNSTAAGKEVMFTPATPGVYAVELLVADRFGDPLGSDFCIMQVADTTGATIDLKMPATITASGRPTFDASNTSDNDPAFANGAVYDWTFRLGPMEVKATGARPTVQLPKAGVWAATLKVTDPSGNAVMRSFDARVTGAGPATVNQDMVVWAILLPTLSIVGVGLISARVWRGRDGESLAPEHFSELRPHEILGAAPASAGPPFPFKPDRDKDEDHGNPEEE